MKPPICQIGYLLFRSDIHCIILIQTRHRVTLCKTLDDRKENFRDNLIWRKKD